MSSEPFVEYAPGDTVLREGEAASALFVIESGNITVYRADAPEVPLALLGAGDFFGESALLQDARHPASARAETPTRLLRLDAGVLHGVLSENIEIGVQLLRRLVQRLHVAELGSEAAAMPAPPTPPPTASARTLRLRHAGGIIEVAADRDELLIGRPDPATGAVPDIDLGPLDSARTLSRRHARLQRRGDGWCLSEETGVGNGTWVDGERLQPGRAAAVAAGTRLRFGAIEVELLG